jgi:hypothetical protein
VIGADERPPAAVPPRDTLVMLVSPIDGNADAGRLRQAGFRVIVTSQVQSTAGQVIDAAPAAVALELVPAFARETLAFTARISPASRRRGIVLLLYGPHATDADQRTIRELGARWVSLDATGRGALAVAICNALLER